MLQTIVRRYNPLVPSFLAATVRLELLPVGVTRDIKLIRTITLAKVSYPEINLYIPTSQFGRKDATSVPL